MVNRAYIKTIGPRNLGASTTLKETYAYVRGLLPVAGWFARLNILRVLSLRPVYLRECAEQWATMWHGSLPRAFKEALGIAVSTVNRCHY